MKYENMDGIGNYDVECSFCGKPIEVASAMIAGPNDIYCCDECVAACAEAMMDELGAKLERNETGILTWRDCWEYSVADVRHKDLHSNRRRGKASNAASPRGVLTPQDIFEGLTESVVGQEEAKTALSVAAYNHYARLRVNGLSRSGVEIEKSNVLLYGPTGCGKTLLARSLAKVMGVPFALADATKLTEAGYIGADVESVLGLLLEEAEHDVSRAEVGIVFIDEIDKIAARNTGGRVWKDVSGEGVQQALLKMMEGDEVTVPPLKGSRAADGRPVRMDTRNVLFILGGAFPGLEDIVEARTGRKTVGFMDVPRQGLGDEGRVKLLGRATTDDFEQFGMLPELMGRIPVAVALEGLTEQDLERIQVEPANAIAKQYEALFACEDCQLVVSEGARRVIAHEAFTLGTGARGLRTIYERVLCGAMFQLPSISGHKRVVVRESDVTGETRPSVEFERLGKRGGLARRGSGGFVRRLGFSSGD